MDIKDFPLPKNIAEMRSLLEQFAYILPSDKYQAINGILERIEKENGIKSDAEGQAVLLEVLNMLSIDNSSKEKNE